MGSYQNIPEETIELARRLRAEGKKWTEVSRATGYLAETIRRRLDDAYRRQRNRKIEGARQRRFIGTGLINGRSRINDAQAREFLASIPLDTRSPTQRAFGDPLPGRSALDKLKSGSEPRPSGPFSPVKAERTYYLRGFLG